MTATLDNTSATANSDRSETPGHKDLLCWAVQAVLAIYVLPVLAVVMVLGGIIVTVQQTVRGISRLSGAARNLSFARTA